MKIETPEHEELKGIADKELSDFYVKKAEVDDMETTQLADER